MKKLFPLLLITLSLLDVQTSFAAVFNIDVTDYGFAPGDFTASIGDTVKWTADAGNYYTNNSASTSVPTGAAPWSSGSMSPNQSYSYIITKAGSYSYHSTGYYPFSGTFTVMLPVSVPVHNVSVSDNAFSPNSFTAAIGDTVRWTAAGGNIYTNNSISTTVPNGAATWNSGMLTSGQSFAYVITTAGSYSYQSNGFATFTGTFTVGTVATQVNEIASTESKLVFQNPFSDRLLIHSNEAGLVTVFDILGKKVGDIRIESIGQPVEINTSGLVGGIYFVTLSENGKVLQTYKAIKEN